MRPMALHESASSLSIEAIEETMLAAKLCLEHRKPDGGCLGYPAVCLLFTVVNALGEYLLQHDGPTQGKSDPYIRAFADPSFGLSLSEQQIRNLKKWYRNLLVHNGSIAPGAYLTMDGKEPFTFPNGGNSAVIAVLPFYHLVEGAWCRFDKALIDPRAVMAQRNLAGPFCGVQAQDVPIPIVASSGCPVPKNVIREL
jgi:hypothetical protein